MNRLAIIEAQAIKSQVSLIEVAESLGLNVEKSGRTYKALCPFHSEKTPSFVLNEIGKLAGQYKCMGCGAYGDATDLVAHVMNSKKWESRKLIIEHFNVLLPNIDEVENQMVFAQIEIDRMVKIRFKERKSAVTIRLADLLKWMERYAPVPSQLQDYIMDDYFTADGLFEKLLEDTQDFFDEVSLILECESLIAKWEQIFYIYRQRKVVAA